MSSTFESFCASLTPTENRVWQGLAIGRSNPGIAAELFLSCRTVEHHIGVIRDKYLMLTGLTVKEINLRVLLANAYWAREIA